MVKKMSDFKIIYNLPPLSTNQEWCCEGGCDKITPRLHRNVYNRSWDKYGNLMEEQAEYYYTCLQGHLLGVWSEDECDYVKLDDFYYTEHL